jgi:phosphoglycolate phosphatase
MHGGKVMKIFFDLDGTLLDVAPRHYRVYSEVTREMGGAPMEQPAYWDLKRKKAKWAQILPLSGLSVDSEGAFLEKFIRKIEDPSYLEKDQLFPGSLEALRSLHGRGVACYLVSLRRQSERLRKQLEDLGVATYFTEILSGHSETDGSDVKGLLIAAQHPGPGDYIIGDTEADILTGKQLGLHTVAVLSGIRDEGFLRALSPDYVVSDSSKLPAIL